MAWQHYHKAFLIEFPRGSTISPRAGDNRGVDITIPCTAGHVCEEHFTKRMPPEAARAHLASKGWLFKGNRATCPEHMKKDEKPMERISSIDVPAAPPKVVTVDARKAKREAMTWLDQSFSVEKGRYDEGVSDKTIATETGMSEQAVAAMREEFYGPLKEPVEVVNFRKRIADVEQAVENIETQAADTFSAIKEQVARLTSDLAAIVKRNGW